MPYTTKDKQYTFEIKNGILRIKGTTWNQSLANQPYIASAITSLLEDAKALNAAHFDPHSIKVGDLVRFQSGKDVIRVYVTKVFKKSVHGLEIKMSSNPGKGWVIPKDDPTLTAVVELLR